MRIPYSVAVVLELLPAILGMFGFIAYPWGLLLTVLGGIITIILVARTVQGHYAERKILREKIAKEALSFLNGIIRDPSDAHIPCEVWSGGSDGFIRETLGEADYNRWKKFYDAVETRKEFFESRQGPWPDVERLSSLVFESFFKIYNEVSWVRDVIPQERIDNLLARSERNAATYGFVRRLRSQQ